MSLPLSDGRLATWKEEMRPLRSLRSWLLSITSVVLLMAYGALYARVLLPSAYHRSGTTQQASRGCPYHGGATARQPGSAHAFSSKGSPVLRVRGDRRKCPYVLLCTPAFVTTLTVPPLVPQRCRAATVPEENVLSAKRFRQGWSQRGPPRAPQAGAAATASV